MDLNPEVEYHIGRNVPWNKLPVKVKEIFGQSQKGYERAIANYSIRNQLRFSENLIKTIRKDEGKYYEDVLAYSKEHLMLYPYHLSDRVVKGLRITPFQYYSSVLEMIMDQEKSYDSLPNFTAADCLRLLGIGRNQYIELMNKYRASRKLFRRKPARELLPAKPIDICIDPWFLVQVGYIVEEDMALVKANERKIIDYIIDNGGQRAGTLDFDCVHSLYRKGLIYLDVPITSEDYIVVPPLEGFVMNRVLGDYFETLLYKIFVSIDEHTTVGELSSVLDIDAQLIQNAVSLYCRLGFAYKKNLDVDPSGMDPSWKKYQAKKSSYATAEESSIVDELKSALAESDNEHSSPVITVESKGNVAHSILAGHLNPNVAKRIAFLYDSTLTAFLMMGNLSPGLKNHAVTMFEVGKMADESLDSFLLELENISWTDGEGEAQRYFEHAKTLRTTILFLRNNPDVGNKSLDLLRCESLLNLDNLTCSRLLNKNYEILVSMAPLSYEVKPVCSEILPHFGPAIPQVNSIWFKLFLYSITQSGPTSLLLSRGSLLHELPKELQDCERYLVTSWGHDSSVIPGANALFTINEALTHSAVFLQAYGQLGESSTVVVPFPLNHRSSDKKRSSPLHHMYSTWIKHPVIKKLSEIFDFESSCGFVTMMNVRGSSHPQSSSFETDERIGKISMRTKTTLPNVNEEDGQLTFTENHIEEEVADNGNQEPKNGFTDDQCAKLYQEELEQEWTNDAVKPAAFDSRKQKIETLRLNLGGLQEVCVRPSALRLPSDIAIATCDKDMMCCAESSNSRSWLDEWTLLDCQFGLPLFDSDVNGVVCEQLVNNGLFEGNRLEYLIKFNKDLGQQLSRFIKAHQAPNLWNDDIPCPSKNFYYHNGRLQEYDPLKASGL